MAHLIHERRARVFLFSIEEGRNEEDRTIRQYYYKGSQTLYEEHFFIGKELNVSQL